MQLESYQRYPQLQVAEELAPPEVDVGAEGEGGLAIVADSTRKCFVMYLSKQCSMQRALLRSHFYLFRHKSYDSFVLCVESVDCTL